MSESFSPDQVRFNSGTGRFELEVDGNTAFINYRVLTQGEVGLIHTEVPRELEGKGVGSALVEGSLQIIQDRGWTVLPYCPFVHGWMKRHDGFAEVVSYRYPKRDQLQPEPEPEPASHPEGGEAAGEEAAEEDLSAEL